MDLGPGAGDMGGQLIAAGTPEEIVDIPESLTGRYLRDALANGKHPAREPAGVASD